MADSWEGSKIDLEASWHWIDGSEFSLKVIAVMRPCDGTSGLVRGNRRKAVFAFKGLFSKGYLSRFRFGTVGFIAVFGSTGKSETSERNSFSRTRIAGRCTVSFRCDWHAIPADIVLALFSCYSSFTAGVKLL